jgi:hypothetical protein
MSDVWAINRGLMKILHFILTLRWLTRTFFRYANYLTVLFAPIMDGWLRGLIHSSLRSVASLRSFHRFGFLNHKTHFAFYTVFFTVVPTTENCCNYMNML